MSAIIPNMPYIHCWQHYYSVLLKYTGLLVDALAKAAMKYYILLTQMATSIKDPKCTI